MSAVEPNERPDPRKLLEVFVTSGRRQKDFTALVACLSPLVFSSARRRTSSTEMAEEVTQNVFAIMARKASSLLRYSSLEAWALETTRLEAAAIMRAEGRQQRKMAALAAETDLIHATTADQAMNPSSTLADALPALDEALDSLSIPDRAIILQRFYDRKKFQDIAETNGQTEAASKMRLQRALGKLFRRLTSRGVTLTTTTLITLLTTELARAAPATSAASLASKALAASTSLSATTILLNTLNTMSHAMSTTLTAAAVLAMAAIPLSSQYAERSRLESQLAARASVPKATLPVPAGSRPVRASLANQGSNPVADRIVDFLKQKPNNLAIIRSLLDNTSDPLRRDLLLTKIAQMSAEERAQLLADMQKFPAPTLTKRGIASSIAKISPPVSHQEHLERILQFRQTKEDLNYHMQSWATEDPEAALKWYREAEATGKFFPGLGNDFQKETATQFISGAVKTDPQLAMDFYQTTPRDEMTDSALTWLARGLSDLAADAGDLSMVLTLLDAHPAPEDRKDILVTVLSSHVKRQRYDEGAAFVESHEPDEERRYRILQQTFQSVQPASIDGALTWVLEKTFPKHGVGIVTRLVKESDNRDYDYPAWWKRQAPEIRAQLPKLPNYQWEE